MTGLAVAAILAAIGLGAGMLTVLGIELTRRIGGHPTHRRTDPACAEYVEPRGPWARRRFDRARGRSCPTCTGARR